MKDKDPFFEDIYYVDKNIMLHNDEKAVGCKNKCFFCLYSWWNGYRNTNTGYSSGYSYREDDFRSLSWNACNPPEYLVTALDGMDEHTREKINKPISYKYILDKLCEINNYNKKSPQGLKLYQIIGYPWENKNAFDLCDFIKAAKRIDNKLRNELRIFMQISHFIPEQKTPMWFLPFNFNNYREEIKKYNGIVYDGQNIKIYAGKLVSSPNKAMFETIAQRATKNDYILLKKLTSTKILNAPVCQKIKLFKKELNKYFGRQNKESFPNIITPWKYNIKSYDYFIEEIR